ncbi:MAG: 5,6-dimethylbenzimidazole synthase [Rhodospirillales bacterium]|nr:5,6-dimethylbenzimidazole synthase [Rhodospirillales bacterium]MBT5521047.1 5,6-dimethylbenzimidazole synthase [Rhodospirillales bacterium]
MENPESGLRSAVYQTILSRRDVRGQFLPDEVPADVLSRLLIAAHHAPSVGYMQPWSFLVIRETETKQRIKALFDTADAEAAEMFSDKKSDQYRNLKLEGILDAPINLCITCDRNRAGPVVLGRTHMPEMDIYSTVCAVQNLWLAARAEGVGVGWVSIVHEGALKAELGLPGHVIPVAYLCIGYVSEFLEKPELETAGWRKRLALKDLIAFDHWNGEASDARDDELLEQSGLDQKAVMNGSFVGSLADH